MTVTLADLWAGLVLILAVVVLSVAHDLVTARRVRR